MNDISVTRDRLWHSLEMHCLRRDLIMILVAMILFMLFTGGGEFWVTALIIDCISFGPIVIFYIWRSVQIFDKPERYTFYKTTLTQFHQKFPLKAMYFTVVLEEADGSKQIKNTDAIFACHGIVEPVLESYVNSTVTVGLNRETGMVVVIG